MLDKSVICDNNRKNWDWKAYTYTVSDIKKNKAKIIAFSQKMVDMGMQKQAKVMKISNDRRLDQAVFLWFRQNRAEGIPISGPLLCEKALELSRILGGEESQIKASEGWKWGFCKRHGIRQLSFQGEKLSSDKEAADRFVPKSRKLVEEKKLSLNQIFNCDETGLRHPSYQNLPLLLVLRNLLTGGKKPNNVLHSTFAQMSRAV